VNLQNLAQILYKSIRMNKVCAITLRCLFFFVGFKTDKYFFGQIKKYCQTKHNIRTLLAERGGT
jgi:hypothetical protein